jgi:hypothetical protein
MAKSNATTVGEYLAELSDDRRAIIAAVRDMVVRNLPDGYVEAMNWGMISYELPLERYPETYNGQPLIYAALANQKNHCALYLMCVYQDPKNEAALKQGFKKAGKKLNMGKSCIRFRKLDDLALDVLEKIIASTSVKEFIARYEAVKTK